ncbi:MAG: HugZ family protein [Rhodospirillaceae bacterium]|nr:HugZ family protein [Rhodospirillaceae bacterium]
MTNPPLPAATLARRLLRGIDKAALATLMPVGGAPYCSLVQVATAADGVPLLLLSDLAVHTANLKADPRLCLLFDGTEVAGPTLEGPRLSVAGSVVVSDNPAHRARYLARHPGAALFAGFADFAVYRMAVTAAHLVAGFGRIDWLEADEIVRPAPPALAIAEAGIVAHMNEDHADAIQLYAEVLAGQPAGAWRMTGLDTDGIDLRAGGRVARLAFDAPVADPAGARQALIALVQRARAEKG